MDAGVGWTPCRPGKCSIFDGLYQGVFRSENTAGLLAAVVLVLLWNTQADLLKPLRFVGPVLLLLASGSRTSLATVPLTMLAASGVGLLTLRRRRSRAAPHRPPLGISILLPTMWAVAGSLIVLTAELGAYSGRGNIWVSAREALSPFTLFGDGAARWGQLQEAGQIRANFPHSLPLHLAVGLGLFGLTLFVGLVAAYLRSCSATTASALAKRMAPMLAVLGLGLLETSWNPNTFDELGFIMVIVLLVDTDGRTTVSATSDGLAEPTEHALPPHWLLCPTITDNVARASPANWR